jgi:hypothetical protein
MTKILWVIGHTRMRLRSAHQSACVKMMRIDIINEVT